MTLFKNLLTATLLASATLAQAYIVPGDRPAPYPNPPPIERERERDNRYDRDRSRRTSETIRLNRYVRNERLDLLRLANLERNYRGYRVEGVRVLVSRAREVNSSIELLVNGRSDDERRVEVSREIELRPRNYAEIGRDLRSLEIDTRNELLIDRVTIDLVREGGGGVNPPPPGYGEITVPLNLPAYLQPRERLDLTPYIDVRAYRGYRLVGLEIAAQARYGTASFDILINSFNEGRMTMTTTTHYQTIYSRQNLVIGSSFGNLVLLPRGDSTLHSVRLILSR